MSQLPSPPSPDEPIRITWARQLLAAVRSLRITPGPGLVSHQTPAGTTIALAKAIPSKSAAVRVRPFACRIGRDTADGAEDGAQALFCYLPPETADAVRWAGKAVPPAMNLGTKAYPWVRLGEPAGKLWLVLTFPEYSSTVTIDGGPDATPTQWELSFDGTRTDRRWPHLVATIDGEIQQFHLGSLLLGGFGLTTTRAFTTRVVVSEQQGGGYAIVNKRIYVKFANGLAVKTEDAPDELIAKLGACT